MKKEVDCGVIRDLLPLYEDGAASEESQELVRVHLKDCPDCREELRKMRVPLSMPPDEDEEAVKRFLERRAELRRKQNRKVICITVPLALLVVFCLCYALIPRSWDSVSGRIEPDRIMGTYTVFSFDNGRPNIDVLTIDSKYEQDVRMVNAVMDSLRAASFRAELRNVANHTFLAPLFQDDGVKGSEGIVSFSFVKDNEFVADIFLYDTPDHKVHIRMQGESIFYYYHVDGEVYDALSAIIQEYRQLQG